MEFVLHRDMLLATRQGHTIEFKKGEPTHVPPECYKEVIAVGGVPSEEIPEPPRNSNEPADPEARKAKIFEAFTTLIERNERGSFTATGIPKSDSLTDILGFRVDVNERDELWTEYKTPK